MVDTHTQTERYWLVEKCRITNSIIDLNKLLALTAFHKRQFVWDVM